jgi:hypothetical protein
MPKLTSAGACDYVPLTDDQIAFEPTKSVHTKKSERVDVSDVMYMSRSKDNDRLSEYINQYARGSNPMKECNGKTISHNSTQFVQGESYGQVKYSGSNVATTFRPNIRLQDNHSLSRMPWRFEADREKNIVTKPKPQKEPEIREIAVLKAKTHANGSTNLKGQYTKNDGQINLSEVNGVIIDDPLVAYASANCSRPTVGKQDIDIESIKSRLRELEEISIYSNKRILRTGGVHDATRDDLENYQNVNHSNYSVQPNAKSHANIDNRIYTGDVRNKEVLKTSACAGIYNPKNYSDERGLKSVDSFIEDMLLVKNISAGKLFKNAGNEEREQFTPNPRGKDLIDRMNVMNGMRKIKGGVTERVGDKIDLSNVVKMSL